jgi:hypothetical protein
MYRICPLFPLFPLFPLSTYLEPSFCVRTHPPLLPACKLTLFVSPNNPSVLPHPKSRPPGVFQIKKTLTSTSQLLMPCVGKNQPRPPAFWLGEKLAFDSCSNFSPRSTVTVEFIPLPYCVIFSVGFMIYPCDDHH